jgi:hypothetical protein
MDRSEDYAQHDWSQRREVKIDHISVNRYAGTRYWAVWVNGELLAVTVYKKGALAIRDKLSSMALGHYVPVEQAAVEA